MVDKALPQSNWRLNPWFHLLRTVANAQIVSSGTVSALLKHSLPKPFYQYSAERNSTLIGNFFFHRNNPRSYRDKTASLEAFHKAAF